MYFFIFKKQARLVGRLLKEAYEAHGASYFPTPIIDKNEKTVTEKVTTSSDIHQLGIHLMFSYNDYDNMDPIFNAFKALKAGKITQWMYKKNNAANTFKPNFKTENVNENEENDFDSNNTDQLEQIWFLRNNKPYFPKVRRFLLQREENIGKTLNDGLQNPKNNLQNLLIQQQQDYAQNENSAQWEKVQSFVDAFSGNIYE